MNLQSSETGQVDAQSEEWFAPYVEEPAQPSSRDERARRRHHADGHRNPRRRRSRDPKRERQQRIEATMMIASFLFVGALTACFYVVLTR